MAKDSVLFCKIFHSDGREEVPPLILTAALKQETLNQEHGHQGVEWTTELVRQRCYWPGMSADITVGLRLPALSSDKGHGPHSFMGHLHASRPKKISAIDFTLLELSRSGYKNVLVMTGSVNSWLLSPHGLPLWPRSWSQSGFQVWYPEQPSLRPRKEF